MKKYNCYSFKWLLMWILIPILMFFLAMGSVYAYFTATANSQETDFSTAIVRVGFSEDTSVTVVSSSDTFITTVLPGSTLRVQGKVENIGTMSIYSILEFTVNIDGQTQAVEQSYYTANGVELASSNGQYSTGATPIDANASAQFDLELSFDFYAYGDSFQGRGVTVKLTAHALQMKNIPSAVEATNIIMDSINT